MLFPDAKTRPLSVMPADFTSAFPLRPARAHEVCGPGAQAFAAICCGLAGREALWIAPGWRAERLHPAGLARFCSPEKLLIAEAGGHVETLALAEEGLRSGAVGVVVAEVEQPVDLTASRRLQLAAEAGKTLGVLIIPEGAGGNAAETRWRCAPVFDAHTDPADSTPQRWELIKNKSGTIGDWIVRWDEQTHRIAGVSPAGE